MFKQRRPILFILIGAAALFFAACSPQTEAVPVEVTRVVTETVTVEGETIEVTRVVTETVVEAPEEEPEVEQPKDLIVCVGQEPDSLYTHGSSLLASSTIQHALFETDITNLSYGYQAHGIESLPSLSNGGAVINEVEVQAGDTVLNVAGDVVELAEDEVVQTSDGEEATFDGTPLTMSQLVVDFTLKPRVWSDGIPVTAADSVYGFEVDGHPDTQTGKFTIERTVSYEATGELSTRWTGVPGFMDSQYFLNYGDYANSRPDWFEDVRVRQAMLMCTNRQSMVDSILYGRTQIIHTYVPSVHPLFPEEGLTEWPYDVEAANALLDEVGFVDSDGDGLREYYAANAAGGDPSWDGTPFSVNALTTVANDMRQQIMQVFKENMTDCGINVELNYLPAGEYFADGPDGPLFGRRYDLGLFAWLTGVDPSCDLFKGANVTGPIDEGLGGWGNVNNTGWVNEAFDAACTQAQGNLPGTPEYEEGHKEAQRIFSQEVPILPVFLRLKVAAARPGVLNFGVDPTQNSELWNIFEIDLE